MNQERTYKWIQDRLKDLHLGIISETDLRRLNEMAATDPFLADALEGYKSLPHADHTTRLNTLAYRIRQKKVIKRKWLVPAMAASLLALVAIWTLVDITKPQREVLVASETESLSTPDQSAEILLTPDSVYENIVSNQDAGTDVIEEPSGLRANAQARAKDYNETKTEASVKTDAVRDEASITSAEVKEPETYTFPEQSQPPSFATSALKNEDGGEGTKTMDADLHQPKTLAADDEGLYANQMSPALMARRVTGKVVSEKGAPLFAVYLNVQNTNLGTTTDERGQFELFLPTAESIVDVIYSGYVDASLKLTQGTEDVLITLPENETMKQEIVVSGVQVEKTTNVPAGRAYSPTRPTTGSYTEYLQKNSRFPIQDKMTTSGNEVMLEFQISTNGRPGEIEIVQPSQNPKLDQEAIRLIRKGPDWECELGLYPCTAQYTIYFK